VVEHPSNANTGHSVPHSSIRTVAIPSEHGGWSLTLEPVILGLLVASSASGAALGLAALLVFMARTPIKLALVDRRRGHWRARSRLAVIVAIVELAVVASLVAFAVLTARSPFWWPLVIAAPAVAVELWYDIRSRSRRLVPELAGAIGIGSMAAAVALTGGAASDVAAGLWLVIAARGVAAVTFVRVQLNRAKEQRFRLLHSDLGQILAVVIVVVGLAGGVIPLPAVAVISVVAVFDVVMVRRAPVPTAMLGAQQVVLGLVVVLVTGLAVATP
jgi:hypothetical protein